MWHNYLSTESFKLILVKFTSIINFILVKIISEVNKDYNKVYRCFCCSYIWEQLKRFLRNIASIV